MSLSIFLKLDKVKGESKSPRHFGEIEVLAFSFAPQYFGRLNAAGITQNGQNSRPFTDVSVVKRLDSISQMLFNSCIAGNIFSKGCLMIEKFTDGKVVKSQIIDLKNIQITSISSGNGDERFPTENISLSCQEVKIKYFS